jgi:hypothetical protein
MKTHIIAGVLVLTATRLLAADPKDELNAAAKKLADQPNYSWKQTTENAGGGGFGGGTSEGKIEKDGLMWVSLPGRDNTTIEAYKHGEKCAVKTQDGWQSVAEMSNEQGRGRFMAMRFRNLKAPATQVEDLVAASKEIKKEGDVYSFDLTEEGAKSQLMFGGRRGGGNGPEISGAKASAKAWVKDGRLAKYELKVKGTMSFNGNDRDIDRTSTVEIKDIGSTKLEVPADAKKKME